MSAGRLWQGATLRPRSSNVPCADPLVVPIRDADVGDRLQRRTPNSRVQPLALDQWRDAVARAPDQGGRRREPSEIGGRRADRARFRQQQVGQPSRIGLGGAFASERRSRFRPARSSSPPFGRAAQRAAGGWPRYSPTSPLSAPAPRPADRAPTATTRGPRPVVFVVGKSERGVDENHRADLRCARVGSTRMGNWQ